MTRNLYGLVKTPARARELFFSAQMDAESVARYQAKLTDGAYLAYLDMILFDHPSVPKIRARGVPILVIQGDEDRSIGKSDAAATVRAYGAETRTFPGQGHDLMLDVGWEQVAACIDEFVTQHSLQVPPPEDQQVVEQLPTGGADPALGKGVRSR